MFSVRVVRRRSLITITYTATGFLYKMARLITGALVQCGRSKMRTENIERFLSHPEMGKCSHVAPADGLILLRVRY
jgi:tRNA pseudouridine38-40 synthase